MEAQMLHSRKKHRRSVCLSVSRLILIHGYFWKSLILRWVNSFLKQPTTSSSTKNLKGLFFFFFPLNEKLGRCLKHDLNVPLPSAAAAAVRGKSTDFTSANSGVQVTWFLKTFYQKGAVCWTRKSDVYMLHGVFWLNGQIRDFGDLYSAGRKGAALQTKHRWDVLTKCL